MLVPPTAGAETPTSAADHRAISWAGCDVALLVPVQCATLPVPLHHDEPFGRTIPFALYRVAATGGPAAHQGALFVNPGGPGGAGLDFLLYLAQVVDPEVLRVYDLIAFDPRGVGASDGLECGVGVAFPYSLGDDPVAEALTTGQALGAECLTEDAELVAAMGTVNVARDLDLARASLGLPRLDYLGYSYGTRIGAVYAALFPDRVGRFVLDGAVDPAQSYRTAMIDQMAGFEDGLHRFFDACDAEVTCAFRGDGPGGTQARFAALLERAAAEGLTVGSAANTDDTVDEGELVGGFVGYLYGGHQLFPYLAQVLAAAEAGDASQLAADAAGAASGALGQYFAVMCADADARYGRPEANFATWSLRDRAEVFGPAVLEILFCDAFPEAAEPVPGLDGDGLPPALILGNTHDPATPYAAAVSLREHWPAASLLTYEGDGHTIAFSGNSCTDAAVVAFLVDGELVADGRRCRPDPVLGIQPVALPDGTLLLAAVDPAGPSAGIVEPGDVLVSVQGGPPTFDALVAALADGGEIDVTIERGGTRVDAVLQPGPPAYWLP
ncbi:MAG: alpha/beta fold hydrolase [Vicinamibacterales bacterium]